MSAKSRTAKGRLLLPFKAIALAAAIALPSAAAWAQDLRIAMKGAVDSADPHLLFTINRNVQIHVYEPLVFQDRFLKPLPGLAESWKRLDETSWEFTLRAGVKFHDGSDFTARDVAFSIKRAQDVTGPRTYRHYLKDILKVDPIDDLHVRIVTSVPSPLLPINLTTLGMVSARAAAGAGPEDFKSGKAAIGTGPYRWASWTPGQQVVLERNDAYWGAKEPWAKVTVRTVSNDGARVAGLLSGDDDVIDAVSGSLAARLQNQSKVKLVSDTSIFFLYLTLDQFRDSSPFVADNDGKPMARNPLKDVRVREAISLGLNRAGLSDRVMEGAAAPAGQIAPEGFAGHDPALKQTAYDPQRARQLLRDAGWPNGFQLTLHCLNDRYAGDSQTCQAVASMLTAIGVRSKVEALPASVFFRRAAGKGEPEFSAAMSIFGSSSGDPIQSLVTIVESFDMDKNHGVNNRGRYSNPQVDQLIEQAQTSFDEAEREKLARQATALAVSEGGLIPIYFLKSSWGISSKLQLSPRGDGYTMATLIRPAP
ncbi:peptide/nickel transport system substrate-binding protein [Bosea sp. OK403]|uniref:ABC transporter substrate-binding protein n=1 Tax=Bosea sp. OK403 TaxID=1855286 RepID=UPI0008E9D489|nr:ABC transporter substrate-binding protein [Bosea sp. OK403]SFJ51570.1 peptide/nickel transport system substrate-binding protein [Bosea sp. OK403]